MTDRTQPEAVADCIFRLRGLRHVDRHEVAHAMESMVARIADLEAQLEAIGAGGVQALSAAPEAFLKSVIALCSHRGYSPANIEAWDKDDKWIADLWRQAESMLAASPTPPAEQQASATEGYVQPVPDKCDRITWRGRYYHLPLTEQAAPKAAPAPLSDDVVQKTWELLDELEKLRGADRYDEDWDTLNKRASELRAVLAAQGGKT